VRDDRAADRCGPVATQYRPPSRPPPALVEPGEGPRRRPGLIPALPRAAGLSSTLLSTPAHRAGLQPSSTSSCYLLPR